MKKILSWLMLATLFLGYSCKEEEFDLAEPPTTQDAVFTYSPSSEGVNYITFSNNSPTAFMRMWDFGNGATSNQANPTAYYPFAGVYTVTLTVFTAGGSASFSEDVTIAENDANICNQERITFLTGGCDAPNGKTWVIDKDRPGHFGVGPANETSPIYYQAAANEKTGGGMYDDEYTFFLEDSRFVHESNGDVYINPAQGPNFPGATESPVGDLIAPYDAPDNMNYSISEDSDGNVFMTLNNGGFIGYNTGVSTFQILELTENEMFIKFMDAANDDLAWFHRLIRKGYTPDMPPPPAEASLPINFEGDAIPFGGFGGSNFEQIANPDPSGLNTSATVGQTVKGPEPWAGISVPLTNNVDFGAGTVLKMKVWSPVVGIAKLKFENRDDPNNAMEIDVEIPQTNTWVELEFDFDGAPSDTYGIMALFFDFGNPGNDQVFYFDDIRQTQPSGSAPNLNISFEDEDTPFEAFGNSSFAVIDNPDASGVNTTSRVAEFTKTASSETWAGVSTDLPYFLDFTANNLVKIKVWSPNANAVVLFKLEQIGAPEINVEINATTTVANQWEELTYDLSGLPTDTYNRVVVFMDFGVNGDATYYFDEILQTNGNNDGGGGGETPENTVLPINFEGSQVVFDVFGGSSYEQIANPDPSGINTSANVGQTVKGFEPWAGVTTLLQNDIDFSNGTTFKMKIWSPSVGIAKFKLENRADPNNAFEVDVNITQTNTWEELTFDFSGQPSNTFGRIALFFDFGNPGNDRVFYFDDIIQE